MELQMAQYIICVLIMTNPDPASNDFFKEANIVIQLSYILPETWPAHYHVRRH